MQKWYMNAEQRMMVSIVMLQEWKVAISVANDVWSVKGNCWLEGIAQSTGSALSTPVMLLLRCIVMCEIFLHISWKIKGHLPRRACWVSRRSLCQRYKNFWLTSVALCMHYMEGVL